jgi:flagellar basal-body rod protein FlgC
VNTVFAALDTSASGLTAQRLRMDVIADNLANAETTRTPQGGPFRREMVELLAIPLSARGGGVVVAGIVQDQSPFPLRYDPGNPDADAQGYVRMPNVNVTAEMVDLLAASRAYQANATAFADAVKEGEKALEI